MIRKIAVLQMTSGIDPLSNAETIARAAREASKAGASMLFCPEMSALLDRDRARAAEQVVSESDSLFVQRLRVIARDSAIWIHLGSLPVAVADATSKWRNRSIVIDDTGEIRAVYDKMHLFDVDLPSGERWKESAAYDAGERAVLVQTPIGRLGLTICYDLRFGALYDTLGAAGADLIAVPAAFTVPTGEAHWHILLRARAVEQGCFIVAAAQTGNHEDGRSTYGHSLVVGPWGEVLLDMGQSPGLGIAEINLEDVDQARRAIAAVRHRRTIPSVDVL